MSVTEWLKTGERLKIVHEEITDAQMAAQWAAQALTEGRYELGRTLANIAAQAAQATGDIVHAPMIGQTRDERPARDAATEIVPIVPADSPQTSRCAVLVTVDGIRQPCHGSIALVEHDGFGNAITPYWQHIDPRLNDDHDASRSTPVTY